MYLNRFALIEKHRKIIDKHFTEVADHMIDFQWAWAAIVMRRFKQISADLLKAANRMVHDGSQHEVVRSILIYTIAKRGSPPQKKKLRELYLNAPVIMQLAVIHSAKAFTSGERNALFKTAESHGDLHSLMVAATKAEIKEKASK